MKTYDFEGYLVRLEEQKISIIDRKRTRIFHNRDMKLNKFNLSSLDAAFTKANDKINVVVEQTDTMTVTVSFKDDIIEPFSQIIQLNEVQTLTKNEHTKAIIPIAQTILKRFDNMKCQYKAPIKYDQNQQFGKICDPRGQDWQLQEEYQCQTAGYKDFCKITVDPGHYLITISLFAIAYGQELKMKLDQLNIYSYLPSDPQGYPLDQMTPLIFRYPFSTQIKKQLTLKVAAQSFMPVYIKNCIMTVERIKQ